MGSRPNREKKEFWKEKRPKKGKVNLFKKRAHDFATSIRKKREVGRADRALDFKKAKKEGGAWEKERSTKKRRKEHGKESSETKRCGKGLRTEVRMNSPWPPTERTSRLRRKKRKN